MGTMNMSMENISHPDGVEVKLSTKSINLRALIYFLILSIAGTCLYVYVWDEFSSYNIGYRMGTIAKQLTHFGAFVFYVSAFSVYVAIQTGTLYWLGGKNRKAFRWQTSFTVAGFYLTTPIALKYFRVALLLPGILLGLLPVIHGFCIGEAIIFYMGIFGMLLASADTYFWFKLRPFDEEDLVLANNNFYNVTIIKRNYGKSS